MNAAKELGPRRRRARHDAARHRRPRGAAPDADLAPDVPVVFLTARDAVEDRVAGLTAGGDDYVTKPFSLEELVARLRGLMRRSGAQRAATSSVLTVGDLELDEDSHEVFRDGDEISLTATEFELLRFLMRNPRRVLSKAQILDRVWNYDFGGQANVVELYISYLRKKIDAGREPMIHTMRGAGYVLKPAAEPCATASRPSPRGWSSRGRAGRARLGADRGVRRPWRSAPADRPGRRRPARVSRQPARSRPATARARRRASAEATTATATVAARDRARDVTPTAAPDLVTTAAATTRGALPTTS